MTDGAHLQFLGAVGTVTGSRFLVEAAGRRILVDCGLFQGFKQLRLRNWAPFPFDPAALDAVLLTHAHLDHSGALPLLVRRGYRGRIHCTEGTRDLCGILLPDSGHLQEKDALFANRHGFSKHHPALPLYTLADAEAALRHFAPVAFGEERALDGAALSARFLPAGHILGAAMIALRIGGRRVLFSGDLGRAACPLMPPPTPVDEADVLLVESTYGDRRHDKRDPEDVLAEVITATAARGGTVLVPAFAVGRTQLLLWHLSRLKRARRIPDLPIFLDSPMAQDATDLFARHAGEHKLSAGECRAAFGVARYVNDAEESKALATNHFPKVILSASGMATGGRVLHHLKVYAPDRRNTILFSGFQAGGTRGAAMVAGAPTVKVHGHYIPVEAEVRDLPMLSAHADAEEILAWLRGFRRPPAMTYVVHGEPSAADALRHRIEEELGWACRVPEQGERVALP
jgi:metallo-beta-lactamase family protein